LDLISENLVLQFQAPKIFGRQCLANAQQSSLVQQGSPAVSVLMLFHFHPTEADGVLGSFRVNVSQGPDDRQHPSGSNYLSLGFRDFSPSGFETLSSFGVWAKNSARDIAG
jgi:hypothetical protein